MAPPCTICANPGVRKVVDGYLEDGVSLAGISRALAELGLKLHVETIGRHKLHYQPEPTRAKGERKHDFAVMVRDRMAAAVEKLVPEEREDGSVGIDPILMKDLQPALSSGLKAQNTIDKREQAAKKQTGADILLAMLRALRGEGHPVALLDDPNVIEGEAVELAAMD